MVTFDNIINDILEIAYLEEPILRSLSEEMITTRLS